eukprot:13939671-Ditylum_brightwellii.AAC.1
MSFKAAGPLCVESDDQANASKMALVGMRALGPGCDQGGEEYEVRLNVGALHLVQECHGFVGRL